MQEQLPITLRVSLDEAETERVLVQFLRDYLQSSGRRGYVLGLSGGLDSAVSCALAARAVGADKVTGLVLPDASTQATDLEDAASVARYSGIQSSTVSIQPFLDAFQEMVKEPDRLQLANAKARFRMILLYAEALRRDGLVLGTGNKSEILTAYFTKWGDGGVDVQPLGDLYKTQVRQLARHLGVPERVRTKPPSAGLWKGQTDEADLGITYESLDRVLLGLELHLEHDLIARIVGVPRSEVDRIEGVRSRSQHKRRMPLSPKVGIRTVGLDWRAATQES